MSEKAKINETKRTNDIGEGRSSFTLQVKDGRETIVAFLPGTSRGAKARILVKERAALRSRED